MGFERKNSNAMFFFLKLNEILCRFPSEFIRCFHSPIIMKVENGCLWKVNYYWRDTFFTSMIMEGTVCLKLMFFESELITAQMVSGDQGGESLRIFKKIPKAPEAVGGWDLAMGSKHDRQNRVRVWEYAFSGLSNQIRAKESGFGEFCDPSQVSQDFLLSLQRRTSSSPTCHAFFKRSFFWFLLRGKTCPCFVQSVGWGFQHLGMLSDGESPETCGNMTTRDGKRQMEKNMTPVFTMFFHPRWCRMSSINGTCFMMICCKIVVDTTNDQRLDIAYLCMIHIYYDIYI